MTENRLPRSTFVTTLAWIFIVLAGFSSLVSLLQNILFNVVFRPEMMTGALQDAHHGAPIPGLARFALDHFQWLLAGFLSASLLTLIAAVALLKRQNWGRLVFIGLMAMGVAWEIGSLALLPFVFPSFTQLPDTVPPDLRSQFALMPKLILGFSVLVAIALSALFVWLIKRLTSAEVRLEFVRN